MLKETREMRVLTDSIAWIVARKFVAGAFRGLMSGDSSGRSSLGAAQQGVAWKSLCPFPASRVAATRHPSHPHAPRPRARCAVVAGSEQGNPVIRKVVGSRGAEMLAPIARCQSPPGS